MENALGATASLGTNPGRCVALDNFLKHGAPGRRWGNGGLSLVTNNSAKLQPGKVTFPPRVRAPLVSAGFKADWWRGSSEKKHLFGTLCSCLDVCRQVSIHRTNGHLVDLPSDCPACVILLVYTFGICCHVEAPTSIQQHSWPILSGGMVFICVFSALRAVAPPVSLANTHRPRPDWHCKDWHETKQRCLGWYCSHTCLVPQTTSFKWMFGETTISYIKIWNHPIETAIYEQMFQVPGKHDL